MASVVGGRRAGGGGPSTLAPSSAGGNALGSPGGSGGGGGGGGGGGASGLGAVGPRTPTSRRSPNPNGAKLSPSPIGNVNGSSPIPNASPASTVSPSATSALNALDRQNSVKSGLGLVGSSGAGDAKARSSKAVLDLARNQLAADSAAANNKSPGASKLTISRLQPLGGSGGGGGGTASPVSNGVSPQKLDNALSSPLSGGGGSPSPHPIHPGSAGRTRGGVSALAPARPPNARTIPGRPTAVSRTGSVRSECDWQQHRPSDRWKRRRRQWRPAQSAHTIALECW